MKFDAYGRPETDPSYRMGIPFEYETDMPEEGGDGVYYTRYFPENPGAVHRVTIATANGRRTVKTEVAYGDWGDRAMLTYYPVNSLIEVTVEE